MRLVNKYCQGQYSQVYITEKKNIVKDFPLLRLVILRSPGSPQILKLPHQVSQELVFMKQMTNMQPEATGSIGLNRYISCGVYEVSPKNNQTWTCRKLYSKTYIEMDITWTWSHMKPLNLKCCNPWPFPSRWFRPPWAWSPSWAGRRTGSWTWTRPRQTGGEINKHKTESLMNLDDNCMIIHNLDDTSW